MTDTHPKDSPRYIVAQALKFGGLMLTVAGSLALIRTHERSLFYVSLMPIGLVIWFIGFRIVQKIEDQLNQQNSSKPDNAPSDAPRNPQ